MNTKSIARIAGLGTLASAGALIMSASAWAQAGNGPDADMRYYHGPGMMWGGGQWGGFGMVIGPIFMILVLVGIVLGIVYLVRHLGAGAAPSAQADGRALAILKERYAKGEIDSKEFDERKAKLAD